MPFYTVTDLERDLNHTALQRRKAVDLGRELQELIPDVAEFSPEARQHVQKVLDLIDKRVGALDSHAEFLRSAIRNETRVNEGKALEGHLIAEHGYDPKYAGRIAHATLREEHVNIHEDETAKHLPHRHADNTKAEVA